jgi:hypothetical protein
MKLVRGNSTFVRVGTHLYFGVATYRFPVETGKTLELFSQLKNCGAVRLRRATNIVEIGLERHS